MASVAARERITACPLPPIRGLNRDQASAYVGISTTLFDEMVKDGRMPKPKRANGRTLWDRHQLDRAFDRLPGGDVEDGGEWDVEV